MNKQILFLSVLLFAQNSFATHSIDTCDIHSNRISLDQLDKKTIHQIVKLASAQSIAESNGLFRTNRSVNKLSSVAGKKHEINRAFSAIKKTVNQCIELSMYSSAERNAIEAQLDNVEADIAKLESNYKITREVILDKALSP